MDEYLLQKKIELMVQLATKKQAEEVKLLKSELERFKAIIESLRIQKGQYLAEEAREKEVSLEPHSTQPEQVKVEIPPQQVPPSRPEGKNKCQIPPELAIDKIFYCGNKKF